MSDYADDLLLKTTTFVFPSQCVERILNETAKAINETFTGLKLMLQGSEYILFEILALRAWNSPARQPS